MIKRYLRNLVNHAVNIYSGISLALAVIAFILFSLLDAETYSNFIVIVAFILAFFAFQIASFYAWKDIYESIGEESLTVFENRTRVYVDQFEKGFPTKSIRFSAYFGINNISSQPVILKRVRVLEVKTGTKLIDNAHENPSLSKFDPIENSVKKIMLEYLIPSGTLDPNFRYEFDLALKYTDPEDFVNHFSEFNEIFVKLEFLFGFGNNQDDKTIEFDFRENFRKFKIFVCNKIMENSSNQPYFERLLREL